MKSLDDIKELIDKGNVAQAIEQLNTMLSDDCPERDTAFYLRGNAYRKLGNWQQALNDYGRATEINPESPARQARQAVMDILNFHNKDLYNP